MKEVYDFLIIEHQVKYGCTKYGVGARTLVLTPIQCSLFTTTLNLFRKNITLVVMCIGPIRYSCQVLGMLLGQEEQRLGNCGLQSHKVMTCTVYHPSDLEGKWTLL